MKSKTLTQNLPAQLLGLGLTLLSVLPVGAQTWQTVLNSQFAPGNSAQGNGIAADALGNVFCAGDGHDASGMAHGITLKTDTAQANWFLSDDTNPDSARYQSYLWDLGLGANGNLYSVGQLTPNSTGIPYWYVRKSSNSGVNWSTVDLYQYAPGQWNNASGFAADAEGNIYAVGWGQDVVKGKTRNHWLVRKSTDQGGTWALVDDVQGRTSSGASFVPGAGLFVVGDAYGGSTSSWLVRRSVDSGSTWTTVDSAFAGAAQAVGSDSQGNVYVAGSQVTTVTIKTHPLTTSSYSTWVVRKSSDGGNTWSTVDTFSYPQNMGANAYAIGRNSAGTVIVAGWAFDAQVRSHWLVRTIVSGAWATVDDFQLLPDKHAGARAVVTDVAGNLLVTGYADDATGGHWIVRRLANTSP